MVPSTATHVPSVVASDIPIQDVVTYSGPSTKALETAANWAAESKLARSPPNRVWQSRRPSANVLGTRQA